MKELIKDVYKEKIKSYPKLNKINELCEQITNKAIQRKLFYDVFFLEVEIIGVIIILLGFFYDFGNLSITSNVNSGYNFNIVYMILIFSLKSSVIFTIFYILYDFTKNKMNFFKHHALYR